MEILKTICTFNGDYDISTDGPYFTVQLDGDEVIFETEKKAYRAIHEHILECLFSDMPIYKGILNNDQLQKMIQYLTEVDNRTDLFLFVASHKTNKSDLMAMKDVLDDGYYERFDRYDSDVAEQFITIYQQLKESYISLTCDEEVTT